MADESIKPPTTFNKMLNPSVDYLGTTTRVKFNVNCLRQEKVTFNHWKVLNIYIVYEIEKTINISSFQH